MATTKKPAGLKATLNPGSVTREELTQITKALTALAKEVKNLKDQLAKAKSSPVKNNGDLEKRIRTWAETDIGSPSKASLLSILDSKKI